ncbi:DUF929 family protein [Jatrophihabitans endophyticus]|uniref:DUF929 family protein n=1 Tax=Jatrophihabitans endophyticus TaxID=1206085 RepID=UPI0019ECF587|nr:DUF929 family protein [Jatrophihabitans endophyticus]MBE7187064.1 DUF929 family protein [Jatrophihabitans endophyticus]
MAKSRSTPPSAAQKRLAAERAAAARERIQVAQRRRRLTVILAAVGAVVVVAAILVVVKVVSDNGPKSGKKATTASASVTSTLAGITPSLFDQVGTGSAQSAPQPPKKAQQPLTSGGKPEILFIGGEFCPYCAAERWPLTVTLMRFGTFSHLGQVRSAPDDSAGPDTATLSYHGASYTSRYVDFVGKEIVSNQVNSAGTGWAKLDSLTASQSALFKAAGSSFPYLNFDGKYIGSVQFDPKDLGGSSMNQQQIAKAITDPSTTISKDVLGSANVDTARICQLTGQKPASVCTSSGVQAAAKAIGSH